MALKYGLWIYHVLYVGVKLILIRGLKMAIMSNKQESKEERQWMLEINQALKWRKKYSFEHRWPEINQYYRHEFVESNVPHFNLIYMLGSTLVPSLIYQTPGIINTPRKPGMMYWASFFDAVDNWWIDHAEMKTLAEEAALTSFLYNTCALQIGYDFTEEQVDLNQKMQESSVFKKIHGVADHTRKTNLPWCDFIYPQRFLVAKGTRMMKNCRWAGKFVAVPTKVIKSIKGLRNTDITHVPEEVRRHEHDIWDSIDTEQLGHGFTCLWEIHEAETGTWFWINTDGKFVLPPQEDPLQVNGLPFEVISFNKGSGCIWATPDSIYVESQQLEGDETRRVGRLQRKLANVKFLYDDEVLDKEDLEALLSEDPGGVPIDVPKTKRLSDVVMPLQTNIQVQYLEYQKNLLNDAQLISGIGPNQMGTFAPGRRTKYEAQIVEGVNQLRTAMRREKIAKAIESMTTKANILITKYWNQEMVQQVVGVDGALYWVNAKPEEFKYAEESLATKVNVDSMAPTSRDRKKAEAAELLGLLGNMQQMGANPLPVLQQLLSTFEWLDVRQILPQMQEEMNMQQFSAQQNQLVQKGGLGQTLTGNLSGINNLIARVPQETEGEANV